MADTLALNIKAALNWSFQEQLDLATVSNVSKLEYAQALADGVGSDQADKLWHDQRTVSGSGSEDLDLTSLSQTIFGNALTISFAKIKALLIVNTATVAGEDLLIGGAGSGGNAWAGPLDGDQDAKIHVPADSALLLVNKKGGWSVTGGSQDVLRIANASAQDVTYKIAVIGTSS